MLHFCGQDLCQIDANSRLKLSKRFLDDFAGDHVLSATPSLVLYCLPEGALALYPEAVFAEMRRNELSAIGNLASSLLARRSMRRFGALSCNAAITNQGRITLPEPFRDFAKISPGSNVCVAGVELGVEIWNLDRWNRELEEINSHLNDKNALELAGDLTGIGSVLDQG